MIYAKLRVSAAQRERATHSPKDDGTNLGRRVCGRLSVLDDSINSHAFDTVQLCFRGIIATSIGVRSNLEDIITLTDIKTPRDFRPQTISNDEDDSLQGRCVDFFFQLPTRASASLGAFRTLPLSTTLKGTTSVTQHTAMTDRQVIDGECEISYWVEAQFRLAGQKVGFLHKNVQITDLYPNLRASLSNGAPLTVHAKPDLLARCKLQKSPSLSLSIYEPDVLFDKGARSQKRTVTIPLTVAMEMHRQSAGENRIDSRQSLKCAIVAKWEISDRFSVIAAASNGRRMSSGDVVHKYSTASTQKASVLFRPLPLYEHEDRSKSEPKGQTSYVAASQVELSVPDAISQPSLSWCYLARSYTLNLTLNFHGLQGAPKYKVHSSIPVTVFAHETMVHEAKDEVIVDVAETDFVDLDDEDDLDVRLPTTTQRAREGRPRVATRTPPPPYFR